MTKCMCRGFRDKSVVVSLPMSKALQLSIKRDARKEDDVQCRGWRVIKSYELSA
jgi:hypothetical protein